MTTFTTIRDRLPLLYRPDEDDRAGLLPVLLQAVSANLDAVSQDAGRVLESHWFEYADRALTNQFFARGWELEHRAPDTAAGPAPLPVPSRDVLRAFRALGDLARIGSLLPLPPWRDPIEARETVEAYRDRVRRTVALYRQGLGTLSALRNVVALQLPTVESPVKQRERPVWLEEFAPLIRLLLPIQAPGPPADLIGPMMRWTVQNPGLSEVMPTLYIQGVAPAADRVGTERPLIELYQHGATSPRLGVTYNDTVPPDLILRLRPAFISWLAQENGLQRADAVPNHGRADPTAPGPWQEVTIDGAPGASVTAMIQVYDRSLWLGLDVAGSGELWRYDGQSWTRSATDLPVVHALAQDDQDLLVGTAGGLLRLPLYPETGDPTPSSIAGFDGRQINAIRRTSNGDWWIATDQGASRLETPDQMVLVGTEVFAIAEDLTGALFFGTELGLFQFQPTSNAWYWFEGQNLSDQGPDWRPLDLSSLPGVDEVFLPPVHCVHRGPDASLWLGTERGMARYVAHSEDGLTFTTRLEAFPELTSGPVFTIAQDARGLIWFGTDRGLFRYDGRDFWQFQGDTGAWHDLGRADTFYDAPPASGESDPPARRAWRFLRATDTWQRATPSGRAWTSVAIDPTTLSEPRATGQPTVHAILWTSSVVGDLGAWAGRQFSSRGPVDPAVLETRYKPDETRVVRGGIAAIPPLPPGVSVWRYLSREPDDLVPPRDRPAWTSEGRLLPEPRPETPDSARFDRTAPPPSHYDETIFAFDPAARVWFEFDARQPLTVLARLKTRSPGEQIDPAILDRVWQEMQRLRPAGVRAMLAVEETIVRGYDDATG